MKPVTILVALALFGCSAQPAKQPPQTPQRITATEIFNLRSKCQGIVDKEVQEFQIGVVGNALKADVTSHYNPRTNHCYALVTVTKNFGFEYPQVPNDKYDLALYDAQTRDLLMTASRGNDKTHANDFTRDPSFSTFEAVNEKIQSLMSQE